MENYILLTNEDWASLNRQNGILNSNNEQQTRA